MLPYVSVKHHRAVSDIDSSLMEFQKLFCNTILKFKLEFTCCKLCTADIFSNMEDTRFKIYTLSIGSVFPVRRFCFFAFTLRIREMDARVLFFQALNLQSILSFIYQLPSGFSKRILNSVSISMSVTTERLQHEK